MFSLLACLIVYHAPHLLINFLDTNSPLLVKFMRWPCEVEHKWWHCLLVIEVLGPHRQNLFFWEETAHVRHARFDPF